MRRWRRWIGFSAFHLPHPESSEEIFQRFRWTKESWEDEPVSSAGKKCLKHVQTSRVHASHDTSISCASVGFLRNSIIFLVAPRLLRIVQGSTSPTFVGTTWWQPFLKVSFLYAFAFFSCSFFCLSSSCPLVHSSCLPTLLRLSLLRYRCPGPSSHLSFSVSSLSRSCPLFFASCFFLYSPWRLAING